MNLDADDQYDFERIWRELLGAMPFQPKDVKNPFGLVIKFWTPDGVAAHLCEKFSWSTLRLLKEFDGNPPAPEHLVHALLNEFTLLMEGPCLYDERLYADVELTDEALRLLNGTTDELEKPRLNRLLLEAVCQPFIAQSNGYAQNSKRLMQKARRLVARKVICGETNREAYFTAADVMGEALAKLAGSKAGSKAAWQPERANFITFNDLVMRSHVDHEVNKSGNKLVESINRSAHLNGDEGSSLGDETRFSDGGRAHKQCVQAAEFANVMEMFPEDSLERRLLEAVGWGRGDEKLPEWAATLGVNVKEVKKAQANVARALTQVNYFKRRSR